MIWKTNCCGKNKEDALWGRNTDNLIKSMSFYLKICQSHVFCLKFSQVQMFCDENSLQLVSESTHSGVFWVVYFWQPERKTKKWRFHNDKKEWRVLISHGWCKLLSFKYWTDIIIKPKSPLLFLRLIMLRFRNHS